MFIYALKDPRTDEIRYIGKTVKPLKQRLASHLCPSALKFRNHRTNWIRSLLDEGVCPVIEALRAADTEQELLRLEIEAISAARKSGIRLVNTTDGGEGTSGLKFSAESRQKLSNSHKGLPPRSPESEARRKAAATINKAIARRKKTFIDHLQLHYIDEVPHGV